MEDMPTIGRRLADSVDLFKIVGEGSVEGWCIPPALDSQQDRTGNSAACSPSFPPRRTARHLDRTRAVQSEGSACV